MKNFIKGFMFLSDGFRLIAMPSIRIYILLPLIINTILFIGFFYILFHFLNNFDAWLLGDLPHWLQWIKFIIWIVFFIGFYLLLTYCFVIFANLIAAPFNSLLADKIQLHLTGLSSPPQSLLATIKSIPHAFLRQLNVIFYYIPRMLVMSLLFFLPLLQLIAPLSMFLFNSWCLALTYIDYPADNNRISFAKLRTLLSNNKIVALGFGSATLAVTFIPILNLFVMPAAVAGATKFWITYRD